MDIENINQGKVLTPCFEHLHDAPATVTAPFPFMKLPRSVRNKVYEHLLVVPAIICVRQNHAPFHENNKALLHAERRQLLPGIAYALAQITVDGVKVHFSRFSTTNINILRVSSKLHDEAKTILYANNSFEIVKPTFKLTPPPDYSVPLFPSGCQNLITKLNIRIHNFYDLEWLLDGGCNIIQNNYRGLLTLTLILERQSTTQGFGKKWTRNQQEKWTAYVRRLQNHLSHDLFGAKACKVPGVIPTWIDLRVLFGSEAYDEGGCVSCEPPTCEQAAEQRKRDEMRHALAESWELFKKGGK